MQALAARYANGVRARTAWRVLMQRRGQEPPNRLAVAQMLQTQLEHASDLLASGLAGCLLLRPNKQRSRLQALLAGGSASRSATCSRERLPREAPYSCA